MKFIILLSFVVFASAVEFEIHNNLRGPIWIGILGNGGKPTLAKGGFALNQGQSKIVKANNDWAGRFWARTWCDSKSRHCQTGDCGNRFQCSGAGGVPPVTLVEITLRGWQGQDFYDVSLVDGYNVKASITPVNGRGKCRPVRCNTEINERCPKQLQKRGGNGNKYIIACYSSCAKFNTDQYCCRGRYNTAKTCPTNQWAVNSAALFKKACPDAYSYAYDDATSTFTCVANRYKITFG